MFDRETMNLARKVWDYLLLHARIEKVDILLVLGGHDLRVPEYAAKLYRDGYAPTVTVSGGVAHDDDLLRTGWAKTEAEIFAEVMTANGVPKERIILETSAKNTGENFSFSRRILEEQGHAFHSVLVVTKPYMERRAFATGAKQWPDKSIIVTSPPISFDEYFSHSVNAETPPETVLNIMMGDLQRIAVYGRNGFQIPQEIPADVWEAFSQLKALGYTKHLLSTS